MRIFHILEKYRFDTGSVHQMFQAAVGQRERRHDVVVISKNSSALRERTSEHGVEFVPLPLRHMADVGSVRSLRELIRSRRPDVVHVHKGVAHTLALAAIWRDGVPAFVVNRGVSFPLSIWNRAKYQTRRVDRIVAVCETVRQNVIRSGRIDPARVVVIYGAVDLELFNPTRWNRDDFRAEIGVDPEAFLIIQVGVREWKGWRQLIDAFTLLRARHRNARLALIACKTDHDFEKVRQYAAARGLAREVTAVGYRSDMPRVLASADCVVDTSWAGTGITGTIREAMAMRKPVVATDCGGNRELVSSAAVGWLTPPRDAKALVRALFDIVENSDKAADVAARAMSHVRTNFSKERRLDALEALYREIIQSKNSSR